MTEEHPTSNGPISGTDLLTVLLRLKPRPKEELQTWANNLGIKWRQVELAATQLRIEFKKRGFPARTYWQLPEMPSALDKANAEVHLAMWEYFVLVKTTATVTEKLAALQNVSDTIKRHGGTV